MASVSYYAHEAFNPNDESPTHGVYDNLDILIRITTSKRLEDSTQLRIFDHV